MNHTFEMGRESSEIFTAKVLSHCKTIYNLSVTTWNLWIDASTTCRLRKGVREREIREFVMRLFTRRQQQRLVLIAPRTYPSSLVHTVTRLGRRELAEHSLSR